MIEVWESPLLVLKAKSSVERSDNVPQYTLGCSKMILHWLVHHASELSDCVGDVCARSHCTVDELSNDLHVPALVVRSERLAGVVNGDLER